MYMFCYTVVVGIAGIGYAHIGYLARGLAQSFSKVIEKEVPLQAKVQVTGGYGYKEKYEALVHIQMA